MILVLPAHVIEAMAEDLYRGRPMEYDPVWKAKDPKYRVERRRNPVLAVEAFMRSLNEHSVGTTR